MKKLSFLFDWIGPSGPFRNGVIPDVVDLALAVDGKIQFTNPPNRSMYTIYNMFLTQGILTEMQSTCSIVNEIAQFPDLPKNYVNANGLAQEKLHLYELSTNECFNLERMFHEYFGFFSNYGSTSVSEDLLNKVRCHEVKLVISHLHESFLSDNILTCIHAYFEKNRIPLSQVIYATACMNGSAIYQDFCSRHNIDNHLNCEFIPSYWINLRVEHRYPENNRHLHSAGFTYPSTYTPGPRSRDFVCFNRRYRDHRILFGLLLHKHNLLDKFFFSLDKTRPENGQPFIDFVHQGAEHESNQCADLLDDLKLSSADINSFNNMLPLVVDTNNFDGIVSNQTNDTFLNAFNDSLVHIISETNFFSPIIHMTEKTLKPIVHLQPFIMLGSANSLTYLRELGFKTFSDFWDESYDLEVDSVLRLKKIINLCEKISQWSQEEKLQFTHNVKEIVEYNYNHFLHGKIPTFDIWTEKYGN